MIFLTVVDVLGRYVVNTPVPGAVEVTEILLAAAVFIGLLAASLDGAHIAVSVFTSNLSGSSKNAIRFVTSIISASILLIIAWQIIKVGHRIKYYSGTTPTLEIPLAPIAYGTAILCLLASLVTFPCSLDYRSQNDD
ncbi:TRAP transporter small permease [Palleronia caenipelagi]